MYVDHQTKKALNASDFILMSVNGDHLGPVLNPEMQKHLPENTFRRLCSVRGHPARDQEKSKPKERL